MNIKELKLSKKDKKEVIQGVLYNMDSWDVRQLLSYLLNETRNNNIAYEYIEKYHYQKLIDSLIFNGIIEE